MTETKNVYTWKSCDFDVNRW